jgi:hypothetical protein
MVGSSLVKIQYTKLKLYGNNPVVKNYIYSNGDLDLWPNDLKINRVLPLLQGNRILATGLFPHDNFSSVYWIFTKLGHMIYLWKGLRTLFILGSLPLYRLIIYIDGRILWCTHFLFCNINGTQLQSLLSIEKEQKYWGCLQIHLLSLPNASIDKKLFILYTMCYI